MRRAPRLVQLPERGLYLIEVPLSRVREAGAGVTSFEQRNPEFILQLNDGTTDAGLTDANYLSRFTQASILSGSYKVSDF
jgi:hypothetical protein